MSNTYTFAEVMALFDAFPAYEDTDMEKRWNYMCSNWNAYQVACKEEDFKKLLNMLYVNNENLDSLHDVVFNGIRNFCGIFFNEYPENDMEVAKVLSDYHRVFETKEQFAKYVDEMITDDGEEVCEKSRDEFVADLDIRPAIHYVIERLWY